MRFLAILFASCLTCAGAINFNGAITNYALATNSTTIVATNDFTWAVWVNPQSTNSSYVASFNSPSPTLLFVRRGILISSPTNLKFAVFEQDAADAAISTTTYSVGTWYHIAGVYTGVSSRVIYVNGLPESTNSVAKPAYNGSIFALRGRYLSDTFGASTGGSMYVAEYAAWTRALTQAEISGLALGCNPLDIVGAVMYSPLFGFGSLELSLNGPNWTLYNSPVSMSHPPVRR